MAGVMQSRYKLTRLSRPTSPAVAAAAAAAVAVGDDGWAFGSPIACQGRGVAAGVLDAVPRFSSKSFHCMNPAGSVHRDWRFEKLHVLSERHPPVTTAHERHCFVQQKHHVGQRKQALRNKH